MHLNVLAKYATPFVHGKHFQPSLIFTVKNFEVKDHNVQYKVIVMDKHSSLFWWSVIDEEK